MNNNNNSFSTCPECKGQGKKRRKVRKKAKLHYQNALALFKKNSSIAKAPVKPKGHLYTCKECAGSGLTETKEKPKADTQNYPHVAIIGGGIGGVALAVACLHRSIPFTLYERDDNFEARAQGYGLTLQQASKALSGFGIQKLENGLVSTKHLVHTTNGEVVGEWGLRKWLPDEEKKAAKRTNIHIARQSLRLALLAQLGGQSKVTWGHQFIDFKKTDKQQVELSFNVNGNIKKTEADLIVGADGIRSAVRKQVIGEEKTPLRYLNCMVILGICSLDKLTHLKSSLLDGATVFQTANGNERIYAMPFNTRSVMWQLSFPITEKDAKSLSKQGKKALKDEALSRLAKWHSPIPQLLAATKEANISGYPVYDRELLKAEFLKHEPNLTLIGDAAHPMSPFKGQGANQALLDALSLARKIAKGCAPLSDWKTKGIRENVLTAFEAEMLKRTAPKVKDSAAAADFLHSEIVLRKANEPRGRFLKQQKKR